MNFKNLFYTFRGRVALFIILKSLGIKKGDRVITQSYTCSAVPEAIFATGSKPLFVDIEKEGLIISVDELKKKIKQYKNVKAIIVQYTFGLAPDVKKILQLAKKYKLFVIEDCCHTFLTKVYNKKVGNFGDAAFFSFEWGKPIVAGLGGALYINNKKIYSLIKKNIFLLVSPRISIKIKWAVQFFSYNLLYSHKTYWILKKIYNFLSKFGIVVSNFGNLNIKLLNEEFKWKIIKSAKSIVNNKFNYYILNTSNRNNKVKLILDTIKNNNLDRIIIKNKNIRSDPHFLRIPLWVKNKKKVVAESILKNIEVSTWYNTAIHPIDSDKLKFIGYDKKENPNTEEACQHVISIPIDIPLNKLNELIFIIKKKTIE